MNILSLVVNKGPRFTVKAPVVLAVLTELILFSVGCGGREAQKHNSAGVSLEKVGKLEEAIAQFDMVIRLDPKLALAHYNRAQAYLGIDRIEKSIQDYDQAILDYKKAVSLDRRLALASGYRCALYDDLFQDNVAIKDG